LVKRPRVTRLPWLARAGGENCGGGIRAPVCQHPLPISGAVREVTRSLALSRFLGDTYDWQSQFLFLVEVRRQNLIDPLSRLTHATLLLLIVIFNSH